MHPSLRYFLDPSLKGRGIRFGSPRQGDAGFDLKAAQDMILESGGQCLVPTGLKLAIPEGWVGLVKDRSSLASRRIYTHGGVIDAGYRGEVKIILSNHGCQSLQILAGDKIAQLVVSPCLTRSVEAEHEADLGATERGESGFGSSGR